MLLPDPTKPKHRRVNLKNMQITKVVTKVKGAKNVLSAVGFEDTEDKQNPAMEISEAAATRNQDLLKVADALLSDKLSQLEELIGMQVLLLYSRLCSQASVCPLVWNFFFVPGNTRSITLPARDRCNIQSMQRVKKRG